MFDVVIVGSGLSGLTCANELQKNSKLRVLVVEARSVIGGRVSTNHTFSKHPIELGAELVHGTSVLNQYLSEINSTVTPVYTWAQGDGGPRPQQKVNGGRGYYYIGKESLLLPHDTTDPDFIHMNNVLHNMKTGTSLTESVYDYLVENRVSPRMISLANAGYANTLCSKLYLLPRYQTAQVMNDDANEEESESVCHEGYDRLLTHLSKNNEIWTNWPVHCISWKPNYVSIRSERGEVILAKRVVLATSVAVLKDMIFNPPLSQRRSRIYKMIKMEPCIKIALRFRTRFYPEDFHGMICSDCPVPEFWSISRNSNKDSYIMIAFATSSYAARLSNMSRLELRTTILSQLDRIFGSGKTLASDSYVDMVVQDWTRDRFIRGGYSSPSFHVSSKDREYIASPVQQTLFFAGEYTSPKYMVMQSAIESGIRVAKEVISVRQSKL